GARVVLVSILKATDTALIGATIMGGTNLNPNTVPESGNVSGISSQNLTSPVELTTDAAGNIWIVGNTQSSDFPVTANAHQSTLSGGHDVVLFQIDSSCSNLLYSTYLGGSGVEAGFSILLNHEGNVVIAGATQSANFPTTAGVLHSTAPGGACDGFVSVIDATTGALLTSTYIGTDNVDQVVNLQIDPSGDLFLLGRTEGNYPISPGVYAMPNTDVFIDRISADLDTSVLSTRL